MSDTGHTVQKYLNSTITFPTTWRCAGDFFKALLGGMGVTSAWSPLGNFLEGQVQPDRRILWLY